MRRLELAEVQAGIAKMKVPRQLGWQVLVTRIEPHQIGPSDKPTTHMSDEGSVLYRKLWFINRIYRLTPMSLEGFFYTNTCLNILDDFLISPNQFR
jgi:hypothetical protein